MCVLAVSCKPAAPARSGPELHDAQVCSNETLLAFDPGSNVVGRRLLPVASQAIGGSKQQIVEIRCDEQESDHDCEARGAALAKGRHPSASIDTAIVHEKRVLQARFEVDGGAVEHNFDSAAALGKHLESLRKAGKRVRLSSARLEPAPGSPRHALSRATLPGRVERHRVLRLELYIEPSSGSSLSALLRASKRVARNGWQLHSWKSEPGGSFQMEIGCTSPAPPAL